MVYSKWRRKGARGQWSIQNPEKGILDGGCQDECDVAYLSQPSASLTNVITTRQCKLIYVPLHHLSHHIAIRSQGTIAYKRLLSLQFRHWFWNSDRFFILMIFTNEVDPVDDQGSGCRLMQVANLGPRSEFQFLLSQMRVRCSISGSEAFLSKRKVLNLQLTLVHAHHIMSSEVLF